MREHRATIIERRVLFGVAWGQVVAAFSRRRDPESDALQEKMFVVVLGLGEARSK